MGPGYIAYVCIIVVAGICCAVWVHRRIRSVEHARADRVEKLRRFDAVRTQTPIEDHVGLARERGKLSIETSFSLIRRVLIPLLLLVIALLLVVPLLFEAPATVLSLVAAVMAVIVGIAAKPLLENLVAGILISFTQPIRIGDTVLIDEHFGTVEDISIVHTTIKIWDWRRYLVPNNLLLQKEFVSYSIIDRYQWAYVEFFVSHESDLATVRRIAEGAPRKSDHFADYEPPRFWIMDLGKDAYRCWIAAWADTPSAAWQLKHDIRTELLEQFQQAGIRTHVHRHAWEPGDKLTAAGAAGFVAMTTES